HACRRWARHLDTTLLLAHCAGCPERLLELQPDRLASRLQRQEDAAQRWRGDDRRRLPLPARFHRRRRQRVLLRIGWRDPPEDQHRRRRHDAGRLRCVALGAGERHGSTLLARPEGPRRRLRLRDGGYARAVGMHLFGPLAGYGRRGDRPERRLLRRGAAGIHRIHALIGLPGDSSVSTELCRERCVTTGPILLRLASLCGLLALAGCASLPNGSNWGEDATVQPGWQRAGRAALAAVEAPGFWLPLAGAAVLQINNWD